MLQKKVSELGRILLIFLLRLAVAGFYGDTIFTIFDVSPIMGCDPPASLVVEELEAIRKYLGGLILFWF